MACVQGEASGASVANRSPQHQQCQHLPFITLGRCNPPCGGEAPPRSLPLWLRGVWVCRPNTEVPEEGVVKSFLLCRVGICWHQNEGEISAYTHSSRDMLLTKMSSSHIFQSCFFQVPDQPEKPFVACQKLQHFFFFSDHFFLAH